MDPIPGNIVRFMQANIESLEQLELLRVLSEQPDREWEMEPLGREAQAGPQVAAHLIALSARGLVTVVTTGGKTSYRHGGRIAIMHDQQPKLLPAEKFADFKGPAPFLPKSPGHHQQWIEACKTGSRTGSNSAYAAPFTEIVLLGNVAFRAGATIEFDPATIKVTNAPAANQYLTRSYRKGWEL
ncbi:MAG: hypothetical protein WD176_06090 [Pirellulales bacterium]